MTIRMWLPNNLAGTIIGKGGASIKAIRDESACRVTIAEPVQAGAERLVTIVGPPVSISRAVELMLDRIESDAARSDGGGGGGCGSSSSGGGAAASAVADTPGTQSNGASSGGGGGGGVTHSLKLCLGNHQVGAVIGKAGAQIKALREDTGATIRVETALAVTGERHVTVIGSRTEVQLAFHLLVLKLVSVPDEPLSANQPAKYQRTAMGAPTAPGLRGTYYGAYGPPGGHTGAHYGASAFGQNGAAGYYVPMPAGSAQNGAPPGGGGQYYVGQGLAQGLPGAYVVHAGARSSAPGPVGAASSFYAGAASVYGAQQQSAMASTFSSSPAHATPPLAPPPAGYGAPPYGATATAYQQQNGQGYSCSHPSHIGMTNPGTALTNPSTSPNPSTSTSASAGTRGSAGAGARGSASLGADPSTGWKQMVDDESGYPYWYNTVTGDSTWDKPPGAKEVNPGTALANPGTALANGYGGGTASAAGAAAAARVTAATPTGGADGEVMQLVPSALAGRLIGKGGSGIRELRDVSRASIRILSDCEPGTEQRKLTVSGTPEAIQMALSMIAQKLSQGP